MEKGVNVLVAGCRFGRMVYELAKLGYNVEGNERTYLYLLVANYLFNYSKKNENENNNNEIKNNIDTNQKQNQNSINKIINKNISIKFENILEDQKSKYYVLLRKIQW